MGNADNSDTSHAQQPRPWHPALESARAAFGALRSAAARRPGDSHADQESAGAPPDAEPVTVIPAAGARPAHAHTFANQWHTWRGRLAQASRRLTPPRPRRQQTPGVPLLPAPWFRAARRWSPGLIPPALALALLGVLALVGHLTGRGSGILPPAQILPLALIYLIGGTIYGIALYYAPTNNLWLAVLGGGAALYLLATLWVLAGPIAVAAVAVLLCVPVYFYVRRRRHTVPAGQAAVTTLAGGYHRTLGPGTTVLVPGERTLATVDTSDRQVDVPTQRVRVSDPDGEGFVARAAAALAYHVTPGQAHLAALAADTWEADLEQHAEAALRAALGEWGHRLLDGEELPERFLARNALDDLRPRVRDDGVTILWVNVRDIWLTPESEVIPVNEWNDAASSARDAHDEEGSASYEATRPDSAGMRPDDPAPHPRPASAAAALPAIDDAQSLYGSSEPLERETLTPDALADAYEAVRDGQIADPETIREIARAFLAVAHDAELVEDFPYDAVGAAQILMERATALERTGMGRGNPQH